MRFVIVKTSSIGDIIQCYPVISLIKNNFPKAKIDWVVEKNCIGPLEQHSDIEVIHILEWRRWRKNIYKHRDEIKTFIKKFRKYKYNYLIDLQGNIKSGFINYCARAEEKIGTSLYCASEWPNIFSLSHRYSVDKQSQISLQYLSIFEKHFKVNAPKNLKPPRLMVSYEQKRWIKSLIKPCFNIMICPGTSWSNKKLTKSFWQKIIEKKMKENKTFFYFVWGSKKEHEEVLTLSKSCRSNALVLPKISFSIWQHLMLEMDVIYTVDSCALHLAGTTNTKTCSFFGPSSAKIFKPTLSYHTAFQGRCPYNVSFVKRCPSLRKCKTGSCIKEIQINADI